MASIYEKQIANPDHCSIQTGKNRYICHAESSESGSYVKGEKMRFTRLAAERIISHTDDIFLKAVAKIVPCEFKSW